MEERFPRSSRIEIGVGVVVTALQFLFPNSVGIGRGLLALGLLIIAHGVFPDLFRIRFWTEERLYYVFAALFFSVTAWAIVHPPGQFTKLTVPADVPAPGLP